MFRVSDIDAMTKNLFKVDDVFHHKKRRDVFKVDDIILSIKHYLSVNNVEYDNLTCDKQLLTSRLFSVFGLGAQLCWTLTLYWDGKLHVYRSKLFVYQSVQPC
jgi:hypothetical protein